MSRRTELWSVGNADINPAKILSLKWTQKDGGLVGLLKMEGELGATSYWGEEADILFRYAMHARTRPPELSEGQRQEAMAALFPPADTDGE